MIYTIYMPEDSSGFLSLDRLENDDPRFDNLVALPDGIAKWALVFPPFWLAYHRLWWPLIIYLAVIGLILTLLSTPFAPISMFLGGLPGVYLLLEGNQLRRNAVEAKGMAMQAVVDAENEKIAIERFLYHWEEPAIVQNPPTNHKQPSTEKTEFGMFAQEGF